MLRRWREQLPERGWCGGRQEGGGGRPDGELWHWGVNDCSDDAQGVSRDWQCVYRFWTDMPEGTSEQEKEYE